MDHARQKQQFQSLTRPWRDRLFSVARRQTRSQDIAEDWIQETLLRAWRDFDQLTDTVAVYAWLLRILNRVVADDNRRDARRHRLAPMLMINDDNLLQDHPCAAPGPFEQIMQNQSDEQVIAAIQALPDAFRQVVMLRDIEGLSYQDLGLALDLPSGTVMSRLSRGRRLLAGLLIKNGAVQPQSTPAGTPKIRESVDDTI
ncbi:RNA polymerase sigma factor [Marinobacterium rhizophilum]|uniref:Sigma-70 family RNA polymerase sigma factor n=1 Tax=Marinobacterium rhizophilum TaxID=420402 RepID=A0ABY5HGU0_9GAMM|nr:sigma-70 family RNA polymerase sigma factor [Marinobacterium rhizophilum]UTW11577.1 sigma-70 family RNA polymerase sigma factor [Marinobacterium rhizophilum]